MARRPSLAVLIIVAGAFFLIGLYTAFLQGPSPPGNVSTRPPGTVEPTPEQADEDHTILFLGVDDLQAEDPELRAVWFLSFRTSAPDLFLLGVPIERAISGDPPQSLQDPFSLEPDSRPASAFLESLYQTVPLEVDTTVVMDEIAFATAIDYVGGVSINDAEFTGQEVLGILALSSEDSANTIALQKRILESLAAMSPQLGQSPEITPLVQLIPAHMYTSRSVNELVGLIAPLLPIHPENTHIELY